MAGDVIAAEHMLGADFQIIEINHASFIQQLCLAVHRLCIGLGATPICRLDSVPWHRIFPPPAGIRS